MGKFLEELMRMSLYSFQIFLKSLKIIRANILKLLLRMKSI